MYVTVGGGEVIRTKEIIGIFDMDTATVARTSKKFLTEKEREGKLVNYCRDLPKSFLLCKDKIVICDLNTKTIKGRIDRKEDMPVRQKSPSP